MLHAQEEVFGKSLNEAAVLADSLGRWGSGAWARCPNANVVYVGAGQICVICVLNDFLYQLSPYCSCHWTKQRD